VEWLCYTDGSVKAGEGGPGGWGFTIRGPAGERLEGWGKAKGTQSKVMEYQAVAEALTALPEKSAAVVFSDDQAMVENLSKSLEVWRARDFAKVDPLIAPAARRISEALMARQLTVRWQWLRSHNGNEGNERADELAAQGAREAKKEVEAELEALRKAKRRR
jgi:ribonuclease HI